MRNHCTVTEPLWNLTRSNVTWKWGQTENQAFEQLKNAISMKCMAYFRKDWLTEVIVDASPTGLGAVLTQINPENKNERHIVLFLSRMLTEVERRYSQCEKEALAVVWACERAWLYLFGQKFTIVTDNRAIKLIFSNTVAKPPARIERMQLRLSQFNFDVVHRAGSSNMADFYSRHPCKAAPSAFLEELKAENHINFVATNSTPRAMTTNEIAVESSKDVEMQTLLAWISGKQKGTLPPCLVEYKHIFDELNATNNGIILRGQRILIPPKLREKVVTLAHTGHQGIVKTKALIRS